MKKIKIKGWKKYVFEFFSIFIAVVTAFALNNWNDNRKANKSENKILVEISNGLEKDIVDIHQNKLGHKNGILACDYFRDVLMGKKVNSDSLLLRYRALTRDFISIQNTAAYETLKSRGLELVKNDSLRLKIISIYEYDYTTLLKLEEEYYEMQFQENYFKDINDEIATNFIIDSIGNITGIDLPLKIQEDKRNKLLLYLWKIKSNRNFTLEYYSAIEKKVNRVRESINNEIK